MGPRPSPSRNLQFWNPQLQLVFKIGIPATGGNILRSQVSFENVDIKRTTGSYYSVRTIV